MKTRTLLYTLSASVLMTLTSCNNWLDTGSSTQIRGDELLKTEAGFLDALTGIYINMSSSSMYGKNMTSYVVDMLVQPYTDFRSASNERSALMSGQYNDAQAVPFIESMWNNTYKTIASINNELKYVEANEDEVLSPFVQNMIKGELLALRAFLHLDLMRLYGYGDLQNMEDRETHPDHSLCHRIRQGDDSAADLSQNDRTDDRRSGKCHQMPGDRPHSGKERGAGSGQQGRILE